MVEGPGKAVEEVEEEYTVGLLVGGKCYGADKNICSDTLDFHCIN